jgi:N6-L-threonylcarbamoyladenine synthase
MESAAATDGFRLEVPPLRYCGDNAAMIGAAAAARASAGWPPGTELWTSIGVDDQRVRRP